MSTKYWKLITIFFLLVSIGAVAFIGWQQRQPILQKLTTGKKINLDTSRGPNLSPASKTQLQQFADSKDWILGINVIKVDFKANTREATWLYFKEPAVDQAWADYRAKSLYAPLFGQSESNNQRLVNLINGQFQCIRTLDTQASISVPTINQYSLSTCLTPIPPGYGDFVGFFNIFLRRQPTGAEILELEKVAESISLDIYQRDIVKSTLKFGEAIK